MPASQEHRDAIKLLRPHCKASLGIVRGALCKEVEAGILRCCEDLIRKLSEEGKKQLMEGTIPDEIGAEEIADSFCRPTAAPLKEPATKYGNSRAFDKFMVDNRTRFKEEAAKVEEVGTRMLTCESREAMVKRLGWRVWKQMPDAEKAEYVNRVNLPPSPKEEEEEEKVASSASLRTAKLKQSTKATVTDDMLASAESDQDRHA